MIFGIDVNLLIKIVLGVVALYGLILLVVGIFAGWGSVKTILRYTYKFGWIILAIIAAVVVSKSLKGKKQEVDDKIEKLKEIEHKTKEDQRELERLEGEKKKIEDEIQSKTDEYKNKLDELKKKPSKPGDAGRSSDNMNDAWRR